MNENASARPSLAWLVPAILVLLVGWILVDAYRGRGISIELSFPNGHGLATGDPVKCRGIQVGVVDSVVLVEDGVLVTVEVDSLNGDRLAQTGTRWWISRPELDWSRVSGLDSIVGPRFIQVDPAHDGGVSSQACRSFIGLSEAPVLERHDAGDLLVTLVADGRESLHPGAALSYRGVRIGTILSTALASNATGVVAEVLVRARYTPLVRENSRFFQTGAFDLDIGLTGFRARLDSLETLVVGGVSLVTPTEPGAPVSSGHRFEVAVEPDEDWFEWRPVIPLGS